jgi:2-methylisocitrate lyase-like PEP mutase family enzyme
MAHPDTLRALIQAPELLVMPGIFDGFSAGFELNLAAVTRLVACCPIPLLADADTGYGNAVNVYHTTRAFEQAGVAGLMLKPRHHDLSASGE